ncbi:MAG: 30S ribosomal protein S16, partial [Desulfobulbaceae bacterium]|nr:30S ribosomal protein S16 [Desulfobulbaceae bacterium]
EQVGTYDPMKDPFEVKLNQEKLQSWLDKGALPTTTVKNLIKKAAAAAAPAE